MDWRGAVKKIESIYLEEGIPPAIVEQSRGRGFTLMRTVYDHMHVIYASERVHEVQSRAFGALEDYELLGADKAAPLDGAEKVLNWLRSNGYQCAIVSSNATSAIENNLTHLGLTHFFSGVFGRDPSCRLKPYPDQNRLCLTSLGWQAKETVLVGDTPDDILSAKPLSIFTVGISDDAKKRQALLEAKPDRMIQGLTELPSVLQAAQRV